MRQRQWVIRSKWSGVWAGGSALEGLADPAQQLRLEVVGHRGARGRLDRRHNLLVPHAAAVEATSLTGHKVCARQMGKEGEVNE